VLLRKRNLFAAFFLSLGGCSLYSEKVSCPKTAILAEFSKTVSFHNRLPIRTDLDSLIPKCTRDNVYVYVNFRVRMTSIRPLSNYHEPLTIKPSYFVAVVDDIGNILSRSDHELEISFEKMQTTKVSFFKVEEIIPVHKKAALYIGFNLDESQVAWLKKEREKGFSKSRAPK